MQIFGLKLMWVNNINDNCVSNCHPLKKINWIKGIKSKQTNKTNKTDNMIKMISIDKNNKINVGLTLK